MCEYKYTLCHIERGRKKRGKILYTSLILSHHHSHIHKSFLSLLKKHIEGVRAKKKKKTFSTLSLSLITTHIDTSHLYLYWKNKHKNIRKESKKKRKEKRWGDIEIFLRYVTLSFFQFSFFLIIKNIFPISLLSALPLALLDIQFILLFF